MASSDVADVGGLTARSRLLAHDPILRAFVACARELLARDYIVPACRAILALDPMSDPDWQRHFTADELATRRVEGRDLSGCSLAGAILSGFVLVDCVLDRIAGRGLSLSTASLTRCRLRGADLREASLNGFSLWDCDLDGADLREANLAGATLFHTTLRGARFEGAHAGKSDLFHCDLDGADFQKATLPRINVVGSSLRRVSFAGARVDRAADFSRCDLRGVDLTDAQIGPTSFHDCAVADLRGAPREPWHFRADGLDDSPGADRIRPTEALPADEIPGAATPPDFARSEAWLRARWRSQRVLDPRRAPCELVATGNEFEGMREILRLERPELEPLLASSRPVFLVETPWFPRALLVMMPASLDHRERPVFAALASSDEDVLLLDGSLDALTHLARAEGVQISSADQARDYAHLGYQLTLGAPRRSAWVTGFDQVPWREPASDAVRQAREAWGGRLGPERVEPTDDGWRVTAHTVSAGQLLEHRLGVGRDGRLTSVEFVLADGLPPLSDEDAG